MEICSCCTKYIGKTYFHYSARVPTIFKMEIGYTNIDGTLTFLMENETITKMKLSKA